LHGVPGRPEWFCLIAACGLFHGVGDRGEAAGKKEKQENGNTWGSERERIAGVKAREDLRSAAEELAEAILVIEEELGSRF